jgi:hypothetical protein
MNNPPEPYDREQHLAWLDSLSADETLIVNVPAGHRWNMVAASSIKRWLQEKMDAGLRLRLLESLNGMPDIYLRPEMLAMIEPMCDTAYAIWKEAKTLDREGDIGRMASFRVLTSPRVFDHFVALNPSILAAIKWREAYRGDAAQQQAQYSERASEQTTAPLADEQPRNGVHNVPTEHIGPASEYRGNYPGIPDRFFDRPTRQESVHHFNLHNGQ